SQSIHFKASLKCKEMIDRQILDVVDSGIPFNNIMLHDRPIISADDIGKYFYSLDSTISIPNRIDSTKEWLLTELQTIANEEKNNDWVMEEVELLDKEDYMEAYHTAQYNQRNQLEAFNDYDEEWEFLSDKIMEHYFIPIRQTI